MCVIVCMYVSVCTILSLKKKMYGRSSLFTIPPLIIHAYRLRREWERGKKQVHVTRAEDELGYLVRIMHDKHVEFSDHGCFIELIYIK